jgi:hypothetical protein
VVSGGRGSGKALRNPLNIMKTIKQYEELLEIIMALALRLRPVDGYKYVPSPYRKMSLFIINSNNNNKNSNSNSNTNNSLSSSLT